jgi:hypothetical protein
MAANFLVTRRTFAVVCDGTGDTRNPRRAMLVRMIDLQRVFESEMILPRGVRSPVRDIEL